MSTTFTVNSTNTRYTSEHIEAQYLYANTIVSTSEETGARIVTPVTRNYTFRTQRRVPKTGVMIVGLGGNNGTTVTAGVLANRDGVSWRDKTGVHTPNYFGSLTQCSTVRLGLDTEGNDVHIPFKDILPMVEMNDLVVGGWDISRMNLADAMERAQVISYDLQRQLAPMMREMVPLPSIYSHDFIAANQEDRADNVIPGTPQEQVDTLRRHMREFKAANNLETVIVLWSATTERFAEVQAGVNDTADNLLAAIKRGQVDEISPSTMFAVAAILEGNTYINGSPQNTFVPGLTQLAQLHRVHIAGDDFKTGQTKIKSVLVDFLVSAGIKPRSIVSYNHLGNNDGKNLSSAKQFRSKEISKSNVVDDMVHSNKILYEEGEHPDHVVVIKYVPYVGDSKRAMDEYTSEIFLGGTNTIVLHNTCEDSLLAAPLILDLVVIAELMTRIQYKTEEMQDFEPFHSVLSILAYLLKAPVVPKETPVINALFKQRAALENIFRACLGLPVESNMLLEQKTAGVMKWRAPAAAAQEGARVVA